MAATPPKLSRRRGGTPAPPAAPPEPPFSGWQSIADHTASDRDVLMGYQILLGRDPETSFVIADAKNSPVRAFIRGLMHSGEFQNGVLAPLAGGRPLPHHRFAAGPSVEQIEWLLSRVRLPDDAQATIRAAATWHEMLRGLSSLPDFPQSRGRPMEAAPAAAQVDAVSPADGFVMITLDTPKPGEKLHPGGLINGSGWAIAPSDIVEAAVFLNDQLLTHARYGLPRPDVARNFPHYRHVDHCGFAFSATLPPGIALPEESHIAVAVRTTGGEAGRKGVRVAGPASSGPEAQGADGWPVRLSIEDARMEPDGQLRVRGWAVSRLKMARIVAFLGEIELGDAEHGLKRPDIAAEHPQYANAAAAGFALVRRLVDAPAGPGFLRVQATDEAGRQRQAIVPLTIPQIHQPETKASGEPTETAEAASPAGASVSDTIQYCCDEATWRPDGSLTVSGWVLAESGIEAVEIELDGTSLGSASLGGHRPDVGRRFPTMPGANQCGFRYVRPIPQTVAAPGGPPTLLRLRLRSLAGEMREVPVPLAVGTPAVDEAAPLAADARLEIDRPKLPPDGAPIRVQGALTISGWAVARIGVADVTVLRDGIKLGQAYLGMRREDISLAYPDYKGSLLSGYALVLPPGSVPEGAHEIAVIVTAEDDTVLQRQFGVQVEAADSLPNGSTIRHRLPRPEQAFFRRTLQALNYKPSFRVLVAAPDASPDSLQALALTAASLDRQIYSGWAATILLPTSAACTRARAASAGWALNHKKWRFATARTPADNLADIPQNPIWVILLQAGDELGCDSLLHFAIAAGHDPQARFIYADELRTDPARGRPQPFFKPEWSPELLLGIDYIGRPWCARATLLDRAKISLARLAAGGNYNAVLRLTEAASAAEIRHLPGIFCATAESKPATRLTDHETSEAALIAAMARRGVAGQPVAGRFPESWRLRRRIVSAGRVSIIMPTCFGRGLVRQAIQSIRANTAWADLEIVVLDNVPTTLKREKTWLRKHADVVVNMPGAFNWSRFNNIGARAASGDYLLFLNDDIEAREPGWLEALVEQAQRPEIGVAGARLLYPDGKVQHAGQFLAGDHARHAFRFADADEPGPFGLATVSREMISVTGACLMTRREVFDRLGGFDEAHSIINNDLDFCLRSWQAGLAVIYTPHATLLHHELASRAGLDDSFDQARFTGAWRQRFLRGDPYHPARLTADADHYAADPEPVSLVHVGPSGPPAAQIRRILAVKLDHIGDFITALPAVRALKAQFPNALLCLLAPPATAALARQEPCIDEIIEFTFFHPRSAEGKRDVTEAEYDALTARLAPYHFDLAIDLRMHPDTRQTLRCSGAGFLAGYDHENRFPWLNVALEWEGDIKLVHKRAHISDRLLQLVGAVAAACRADPAWHPRKATDPNSVPALAALPARFLQKPIVCVHPGVGNAVRQWPVASYAALIDLLAGEAGVNVVLIGAGEEIPIADEVLDLVTHKQAVASLAGKIGLADLPQLMRACALFVGNNSGPKHIAAATEVPTLGIHSSVVDPAEWAPLGPQAVAIRREVICGPCYLEFAADCPRGLACLTGITPREVLETCRLLLA